MEYRVEILKLSFERLHSCANKIVPDNFKQYSCVNIAQLNSTYQCRLLITFANSLDPD